MKKCLYCWGLSALNNDIAFYVMDGVMVCVIGMG